MDRYQIDLYAQLYLEILIFGLSWLDTCLSDQFMYRLGFGACLVVAMQKLIGRMQLQYRNTSTVLATCFLMTAFIDACYRHYMKEIKTTFG